MKPQSEKNNKRLNVVRSSLRRSFNTFKSRKELDINLIVSLDNLAKNDTAGTDSDTNSESSTKEFAGVFV